MKRVIQGKCVGSEGVEDQMHLNTVVTSQNGCMKAWIHEGLAGSRRVEEIGTMCGTGG